MLSVPIVDREVFRRYAGRSLPRHVSYPMPTWWRDIGADEAAAIRAESTRAIPAPALSVYLHLPFCEALCKFCACNRTIMRKAAKDADQRTEAYVVALEDEIQRLGASVGTGRPVRQIHWGGGTPTYLSCAHIERIQKTLTAAFSVAEGAEIAIEIDPRVTSNDQLELLRRLGFDRVSLGVQDFDERVQKHIHRIQPYEMVKQCVDVCREIGFASVNFDLIYGMPYQTLETVADMIDRTIALSPDRIAYYHYAQIPDKIANQRGIHHDQMPDSDTKLTMFLMAVEAFTAGGYEFVGLDHFAKPDERLAQAVRDGSINRNFQGMTTEAELDLIGMGASSISQFTRFAYLQNVRDPDVYVQHMNADADPVIRGTRLSRDDCIRQTVINHLYCYAAIDPDRIEKRFDINFGAYFSDELERLKHLEADGLVEVKPDGRIELTWPLGRVLMRNVAAVFDAYLHRDAYRLGERHAFSTSA
ncbi:MAG: oxygen-independent coproporphyrinogen III oxidase [Planctomycetes bacterium]|nr:oxygen-independent coproporphyrinogen III oxidase [Planctomycetota bacterium]